MATLVEEAGKEEEGTEVKKVKGRGEGLGTVASSTMSEIPLSSTAELDAKEKTRGAALPEGVRNGEGALSPATLREEAPHETVKLSQQASVETFRKVTRRGSAEGLLMVKRQSELGP